MLPFGAGALGAGAATVGIRSLGRGGRLAALRRRRCRTRGRPHGRPAAEGSGGGRRGRRRAAAPAPRARPAGRRAPGGGRRDRRGRPQSAAFVSARPVDGRLDLVAQVLDPRDRVLLVLVDAVEVGGVDRRVLPARGLDQQLDHVRVVGLVDADEDLRELVRRRPSEVLADAGEVLAAGLELVLGGGELLLLGLQLGGGGLLGLTRVRDLADQRVDLLVALVELLGDRRLLVADVGERSLLLGDRRVGGRRAQHRRPSRRRRRAAARRPRGRAEGVPALLSKRFGRISVGEGVGTPLGRGRLEVGRPICKRSLTDLQRDLARVAKPLRPCWQGLGPGEVSERSVSG